MIAKLWKFTLQPVHSTVLQVPRALVASGLAAVIDFATLVMLVETAHWHPIPAAVVGYLLGGVLQYILCALWVFSNTPSSATTGFVAFTLLSLVGLGLTWVTISGMYDVMHLPYPLAKFVALGLAFTWNFLSRKFLLFRPMPQQQM